MGLLNSTQGEVELWGGIECTINRVEGNFFDQLEKSGHYNRLADLQLFADLGIRAIRYPVLWERIAPDGLENADWSWADTRLERLRELKIRPIIGLLHHGSGPDYTSLLDPHFPEKFAEYALAVAERYPWAEDYTPINEPLTTARFSGLYGLWYPHGHDNRTFALAVIGQCRATVLAMKSIRQINPKAKFIQTEDLGKVHSTPELKYQADFENERRMLCFDLLCGRVNREHSLWNYLIYCGIEESEIEWFQENSCPPDIIGFNYYLTSERFIDERVERYPGNPIGGNGKHEYVDMEAIRVCTEGCAGLRELMCEAWQRYKLPLAVTEIHLGCSRDEQLRWFNEAWEAAQDLRSEGVDLKAVTAWSLLGSFDWNSLVTRSENHYEPGVFDLRGGKPRPTALARLLCTLSKGQKFEHPVIEGSGWWKLPSRFIAEPVARIHSPNGNKHNGSSNGSKHIIKAPSIKRKRDKTKPLLITGATGTLGQAFARICESRDISYQLLSRRKMDIAQSESVREALSTYEPWAVINTAGYVRVDAAEDEPEICFRENTHGAVNLANACEQNKIQYLSFSSDLVFDGNAANPYVEGDAPNPLNVYGQSKAEAERQILEMYPNALIVRTAAFFSPWDEYNFLKFVLRSLASGETFLAANDSRVSPTYVPDLVNACLDLLIDEENGLWHLTNQGAVTWSEFAENAAELAGFKTSLISGCPSTELNYKAKRPSYSALESEKGILLPGLDDALFRFIEAYKAAR